MSNHNYVTIPFTKNTLSGSNLIVIGSRPQMGRSHFIIEFIKENVCSEDNQTEKPWCFFVEESTRTITEFLDKKIVSKINYSMVEFGQIEEGFISGIEEFISNNPKFILIHKFERMFHPYCNSSKRLLNLSNTILINLKRLSNRYDIPVIITTFLHASAEENFPSHRPMLKDFGSSSLEIAADQIYVLHRPNYFGYEENERGENIENVIEFTNLKGAGFDNKPIFLNLDRITHELKVIRL